MKVQDFRALAFIGVAFLVPLHANAQTTPGVSDTEIRIGHIAPYTGPGAVYGTIGEALRAYFEMVNDQGGINGRTINFISYDDAYNPTRTFEQARRLVELDDVLLIFQGLGVPTNLAIRDYMNENEVPQLFMAAGAWLFDDPSAYPWTMPWTPSMESESIAFADHIAGTFPEATVGVLYLNDAFGQLGLAALTDRLGDRYEIVAQPYDSGDPNVDAQISALRDAGVSVLVNLAPSRTAAQAIRRMAEIGWMPYHILNSAASSITNTFAPAGIENSIGIVTVRYSKDPANPIFAGDPETQAFYAFWDAYGPENKEAGVFETYAYNVAGALVEVLMRCGEDLSRENIMRQAASLIDLELPMLLPGIVVNTGPADFSPIEQFRLSRFDGETFVFFDEVIDATR